MKIITILLLMISTQAQAMANTAEGGLNSFTVEQCNQIANISKRTIKAAIIGKITQPTAILPAIFHLTSFPPLRSPIPITAPTIA